MDNQKIKIGTITILVVLPKEFDHQLTEDEISHVERVVADEFQSRVERSELQGALLVGNSSSEYGCLLVTIEILAVLAAGYKFVKDYPKLREGTIAIAKDFDRLKLKIRGKEYEQGNVVRDTSFDTEEAVNEALEQLRKNKH